LVVEADTEKQACEIANEMLSKSGVVNDGDNGEWYLLSAEIEEPTDAV
jgi:hypothetical protein